MRYKLTALAVALAVLFAGIVMVDGNGSDAVTTESVTLTKGGPAVVKYFTMSENAYDISGAGYTKTVSWQFQKATGAAEDLTGTGGAYSKTDTGSKIVFTLTKLSEARYSVTMSAPSDATLASSTDFKFICKVSVTVTNSGGSSPTAVIDLKTLTYTFNVTLSDPSSTPSLTAMDFTKGVPESKLITSTTITVTDYYWYAVSLPTGLGMARDGTIAGVLDDGISDTSKNYTVNAVQKTATGVPITYTLELTINFKDKAKTGSVELSFDASDNTGKIIGDNTSAKKITFENIGDSTSGAAKPSGTVVVEKSGVMKFKITSTASPFIVDKVVSIGNDSKEAVLTKDASDYYQPDTSGTGSYKVMIYANVNGNDAVLTFNLVVLADLHGDWAPAFVINGN